MSFPIRFKRLKFEPPEPLPSSPTSLNKLPSCLLPSMVSYLPFQDQIHFEQTNHDHKGAFEKEWREKRKPERYTFDWKMCRFSYEREKEKWNYCLTKALILFLNKLPACRNSPAIAINTYEKYTRIAKKFPHFGSFVEERLLPLMGSLTTLPSSEVLWNRKVIMDSGMEGYGGESYLHAITVQREAPNSQTYLSSTAEWLKRAIRQGATLAAYIPWGTPPYPDMSQTTYDGFLMELALEAHEKGDPGPFDKLATHLSPQYLFNLGEIYRNKKEYSRAVLLYALALKKFASNPPPPLLLANMGRTKLILDQIDEADQFLTQALTAYADNPTADVLASAGSTKYRLGLSQKRNGHLLEAHKLFTQADEYITKAIIFYGANVPSRVVSIATCTKCKLAAYLKDSQYYKQVDEFCNTSITVFGDALSIEAKDNAARLKHELGQNEEAKKLYAKVLSDCIALGREPLTETLSSFAEILLDLGEYKEADKFYTKALKARIDYKENPSARELSGAARVKDFLGQYKEAHELYTRAIPAYEGSVPDFARRDADALKAKLDAENKNI